MMKTALFIIALQALCTMAQLAGGWSQKPVDDEQVQVMAAFAVPEVQGDINHTAFFQLASIDAVEAQVVSGMNYRITMTLEETTCDKAAAGDCTAFETAPNAGKVKCTVVVYDQPWTGTRKITSKSCGEVEC